MSLNLCRTNSSEISSIYKMKFEFNIAQHKVCVASTQPQMFPATMPPMLTFSLFQRLRRANKLVIAVLFLYGLTLSVAMAAPVFSGKGISMICTSTGIKFVNESGKIVDGKTTTHTLECSFCMPTAIAPDVPTPEVCPPVHALSYATQSIPAARLAAIVAAPLPARGPPVLA